MVHLFKKMWIERIEYPDDLKKKYHTDYWYVLRDKNGIVMSASTREIAEREMKKLLR